MSDYISLMSLYQYDNSLFDGMEIPPEIDSETVISTLLAQTAEMEVIYPDFMTMKYMLEIFSRARYHSWERLYAVLTYDYNPLYNKDGTVEETVQNQNTGTSQSNAGGVMDHKVTAYNADQPRLSTSDENNTSGTFSSQADGLQTTTRREYGNIGVTTSQQMLKEEIEIRASYDMAHLITAEIKREFCLMVY